MSELDDLREIRDNVGDDVLGQTQKDRLRKLMDEHLLKLLRPQFRPENESSADDGSGSAE